MIFLLRSKIPKRNRIYLERIADGYLQSTSNLENVCVHKQLQSTNTSFGYQRCNLSLFETDIFRHIIRIPSLPKYAPAYIKPTISSTWLYYRFSESRTFCCFVLSQSCAKALYISQKIEIQAWSIAFFYSIGDNRRQGLVVGLSVWGPTFKSSGCLL